MSARTEKIAANKAREEKKRLAQLNRLKDFAPDAYKGDLAFLASRTEASLFVNKTLAKGRRV